MDAAPGRDSDDDNDVGYSNTKSYLEYTRETFARWFCRCCQGPRSRGSSSPAQRAFFLPVVLMYLIVCSTTLAKCYELRSTLRSGHDLKYRYRGASTPIPRANVLFIHPVGVGIASWFFAPMMTDEKLMCCNLIAPDLRGCGDSELVDLNKDGIFLPLDWTRDCEAVMAEEVSDLPTVVVAQGGIAPVALQLGRRNKVTNLASLILTSPPVYKDLIMPIDKGEFSRNLKALQFLKTGVRWLLCRRSAIKFFSNLFLFAGEADDRFLDEATSDAQTPLKIEPVLLFNSGALFTRSWEEEIASLGERLHVVSGAKESQERKDGRLTYGEFGGTLSEVPESCNVIPYEAAEEFEKVIEKVVLSYIQV